ncbi:MAG: hypothetical protein H0T52_11500 [Lautropia sp.]|nr:hypothetical protein [Lautropia sp.]
MKISELIAALRELKKEHGDLTCAEEAPVGFFAVRYVETKQVGPHLAVLGVNPGETVVLIKGQ